MLLSAVSVLVVAQSSSEIPEGLMNNPVCIFNSYVINVKKLSLCDKQEVKQYSEYVSSKL